MTEATPILARASDVAIAGPRVRMRRIEASDVDWVFAMYANAEVSRYLSFPTFTDRAQAAAWIGRVLESEAKGSSLQLAVVRSEDGVALGTCTLFGCNHPESRRAEIGYVLARPYWGAGYMHEALTAFVGFAFRSLGLNRLEADIDPRNTASRRTLERLGFTREGLLRDRWIVAGETSDAEMFGLLSREWPA
jgi:[ribosomal protein S5]-alanine N-acetyltransferase